MKFLVNIEIFASSLIYANNPCGCGKGLIAKSGFDFHRNIDNIY